jgi:hypothetical protein
MFFFVFAQEGHPTGNWGLANPFRGEKKFSSKELTLTVCYGLKLRK